MKERDITKKMLEDAANDMSNAMQFEEPIPTGKKVTKPTLQADIIESAKEIQPDDELKPMTVEVLVALGVEMPLQTSEGEENDITKQMLEAAADDMSNVMKFEEPIPTGEDVDESTLRSDIIEAAKEIQPSDEFAPKTVEVLVALGVEMVPEPEQETEAETEVETESETVPEEVNPPMVTESETEKKKESPVKLNRMAAIVHAMVKGTDLFDKKMEDVSNGLAAASNIKEQKFWLGGVRRFVNALNENGFEIIRKK